MSKDVSKLILKHERYELDFPQERGWTSARSLCSSARRTRLRLLDPLSDRTSLLSPLIPSNTLNNTKRSDRSICAQGCNFNDTLTEPLPLDPPQVKKNKKQKPWKICLYNNAVLFVLFCWTHVFIFGLPRGIAPQRFHRQRLSKEMVKYPRHDQGVRLWNQMKEKGSDSGDFQHRRVNLGDTSIQGKDHFNRCFIYPSSAVLSSLLTALVGE